MRSIHRTVTASLLLLSTIGVAACSPDSTSPGGTTTPATSLRVAVSPKADTIVVGASAQLTARVLDDLNAARDHAVEWRSDNPSVATVSGTGLVAAISLGTAHVIVRAGVAADTATVVVQAPPSSLAVSPGAALVMLGDSLRLVASTSGAAASGATVQWTTSDPSIATVSADGLMSAVEEGSVTITAQLSGITASASVDVLRGSVGSLTVSPPNTSIVAGDRLQLTATALDDNGRAVTGVIPKWSSSNAAVATVSDNGLVTGVAKGLAIISAQSKSRKATASVNVLDVPAATVAVSLGSNTLSVAQTTQATATIKDAQGNVLTGRMIAWQSSNPALATVDSKGLVTAIANGLVTISAICEGKVGGASLTVSSPVPASIAILPSNVSLTLGQNAQMRAEVRDAKGTAIPNQPIKWTSANAAVAPVSTSGSVSAVAIGKTSVQAASGTLTTSAAVDVTPVPVASVTVSPSSLALTVGDTATVSATARDASGTILTDRAVSWSSSNPGVATVAPNGLVTAVSAGSAAISALIDGVTASTPVTVNAPAPAPVASVSVTLGAGSLSNGQTTQAVAVLRDAASNILTGRSVTWSSANTAVATVSSTGLVTAVAPGSASIIATSEGQTGSATLTVNAPAPAPVASVTLSASSTSLLVGSTLQVTVTLKDATGHDLTGRTVGWTSSNTAVATVSPTGLVKGIASGSVTITATSEGQNGTLPLTVSPVPVATVTVTLSATAVYAGQSTQATATLKDAAGNVLTGRSVTWSSSAPSVAAVSASGAVTTSSVGTANVIATSEGKTGSAMLTVSTPPVSPPPTGGSCSLVTGTTAKAASALGKPGYLQSVIDPDFKTTITRITGDPGTPIPVVGGTWPTVAYHNYSKDQAWTADQKLLVLKQMQGTGFALFLDGATYQPLFTRSGPPGGGEWRLHPLLADIAVNLTSSGEVRHWNVRTNTSTLKVAAVAGYTSNEMGPSEGNMSDDGRYLAAKAVRSSDGHLVARVIDIDGGTTGPVIDLTAAGVTNLDWVSMSAGGGYVVAYADISGGSQRTKVWSRATGAQVGYWPDYTFGHYDLGLDASGNEVAFGAVGQTPYSHHYIARRLDNGAIVDLTGPVTSYNWHAGTRSTARHGWGVAATNDVTGYPLDGEIYGVKLDGSGQVERYAHHRSNNIDYDSAPFPSASPDGKRVIFASNWGASTGRPVQAYVVDVRPICP